MQAGTISNTGEKSFNNTGKIKARDIMISMGLDEKAIDEIFRQWFERVTQEQKRQGQSVTDDVKKELRDLFDSKFVEFVCTIRAENRDSEERVKEAIKENIAEFQKSNAMLFENFSAALNEKMAEGKKLLEAIGALLKKAEYGACAALYGLPYDIQNTDNAAMPQRELGFGHAALQAAEFERAKKHFEAVATASYGSDSRSAADAYFGIALAEWQIQLLWDDVKNSEQFILYDYYIDLSERHGAYRTALEIASTEQAEKFKQFVKKLGSAREKLREYDEKSEEKEKELKYDCFICTKVTENGSKAKTDDCQWIKETNLYEVLREKGCTPFFSEEDCTKRAYEQGSLEYESLIYYALWRAKVMLLVCSDKQYLETPWVENEIKRFSKFCEKRGQNPLERIIVVHGDTPVELPSDLGEGYQGWNRREKNADTIAQVVKNAIAKGYVNVERGARYCKICERKYSANDNTDVCINKKCSKAPLVDELTWLNIKWQRTIEKHERELKSEQEDKLRHVREEYEGKIEEYGRKIKEQEKQIEELEEKIKLSPVRSSWFMPESALAIIPDGTEEIQPYEFSHNTNLKGIIIPDSVKSIGAFAFSGCTGLTSITIPGSVECIGDGVFKSCTGLTSITIPGSVECIGNYVFKGCTDLTSITIPGSFKTIGDRTFEGCTGLITILGSSDSIGARAFAGCTSLTSITIPDTVKSIGGCAFAGCTGLRNITIPKSVKSIAWRAFEGCTNLTSVTMPDSVTHIGARAFAGCTSLTSITIPDSVASIEERAFAGCTSLTSITIPNSVDGIGARAFAGCTGLRNITIPKSVKSIAWRAFEGCTNLTSVTMPDSVTHIGEMAFEGCTGLTSVTIPGSVTHIGERAFEGCTGLTSITIPDSVGIIEERAFADCTGLTSITIRHSVTRIGEGVFEGCTGLTSIAIPCFVTHIGERAFEGCAGLTGITIPGSVRIIGERAFAGCALSAAVFRNEKKWYADGTRVPPADLADSTKAAAYLTSTYVDRRWERRHI